MAGRSWTETAKSRGSEAVRADPGWRRRSPGGERGTVAGGAWAERAKSRV